MSPPSTAPSHGRAGERISSVSLLVAGVKGPLYLRGERQMNPRLKQGTSFFFPPLPPDVPPLVQVFFIMSFNSQLRVGGSNKAGEMMGGGEPLAVGKGLSHQCVKRKGSAGIKNVSFMGST